MERALPDSPSDYDPHVDGRPPVGWHDDDPLLKALMREHPHLAPKELLDRLKNGSLAWAATGLKDDHD